MGISRALIVSMLAMSAASPGMAAEWERVGPGGGGRFQFPAIAPDGKTFVCSSDMGSAFAGNVEQPEAIAMIPAPTLSFISSNGFFFHPTKPDLYGAARLHGPMRSRDGGKTWQPLDLPIEKIEWTSSWPLPYAGPWGIAFSTRQPDLGVIVYANHETSGRHPVFATADGGDTWTLAGTLPADIGRLSHVAYRGLDDKGFVIATAKQLFRFDGATIEPFWSPPEGETVVTASVAGKRLYVAVDAKNGGYIRHTNNDTNWKTEQFPDGVRCRWLETSAAKPGTAYFVLTLPPDKNRDDSRVPTVYRTDNAFKSFAPVLFRGQNQKAFNITNPQWTSNAWGWNQPPSGLGVCPTDPDKVVATDHTQIYYSANGGKTWRVFAAPTADKGVTTQAGGMPLLSAYGYYFDPHERANRFIAMNDFCSWLSQDNGQTWRQSNDGNPFAHNNYVALYDDRTTGRVWTGGSVDHDLPHWKWQQTNQNLTHTGGLLRSDDHGRSWKRVGADTLPSGNVTGLVMLPASRTLLAAVYGKGLYASDDHGDTWRESHEGIGPGNRTFFRLRRAPSGTLWALTSVSKPGHLFRSDDDGKTWTKTFADETFPYPVDVVPHPAEPDTLYLAGFSTAPFKDTDGGIRKSVDGGKTWTTLLPGKACWSVALHPERPETLIACTYAEGLYLSRDGGATWTRDETFPAVSPISITFDPEHPDRAYVTCFGASVFRNTVQP